MIHFNIHIGRLLLLKIYLHEFTAIGLFSALWLNSLSQILSKELIF